MIYERKSHVEEGKKKLSTVERNHTLSELVDYYYYYFYIQKQFKHFLL